MLLGNHGQFRFGKTFGAQFDPLSLSPIQYALDGGNSYEASALGGFEVLRSLESYGTYRQPRQGRCYLFDGSNDRAPLTSAITVTGALTLSFWIRPTTNSVGVITGRAINSNASIVYNNISGNISFETLTASSTAFATGLSTSVFQHIMFVRDGSNLLSCYKNNVLVSSQTLTGTYELGQLGARNGVSPTLFFSGRLSDVRLYNVAKDATERTNIFNGGEDTTGLQAQYLCNEESGTVGYDVSGNGNHLTLTNITQSTFHATDTNVSVNRANRVGHTRLLQLAPTSAGWSVSGWVGDRIISDGQEFYYVVSTVADGTLYGLSTETTTPQNYTAIDAGVQVVNSTTLRTWSNNSFSDFTVALAIGSKISFKRVGTTVEIYVNGVLVTTRTGIAGSMRPTLIGNSNTQTVLAEYVGTYASTLVTVSDRIVPRNEAATTLDVNGNTLEFTGQSPYPATVEVPCITGNGTSVYADIGTLISGTSDFNVSFKVFFSVTAGQKTLFSIGTGLAFFRSSGTSNFVLYTLGGSTTAVAGNPGAWNTVSFSRVGNDFSVDINGVVGNGTSTTSLTGTNLLMAYGASQYADDRIADLQITTGGVTTYFPLQDGPGTSNTNRDLSYIKSDGTYGVIASAIVNGTVSTIWANRCTIAKDWSVEYGGDIAANGAFLPGQISGGLASDGTAKTLTAGKFGNPYSRVNFNPFTAAELNALGMETAYAVTTARQSVSPTDTKFRRTKADGDDRLITYATALTGTDKTDVEGYVS